MKKILISMKEIIITYILQYLIIIIPCLIYTSLGYKNLTNFINNKATIILLTFYIITIIYLIRKNKIKEKKYKLNNTYNLISIGISISIIMNMIIFKLTNNLSLRTIYLPLAIISSGIIGPIYEEILFRYIFLNRLKKYYSPKKAILINTIIFALIHINPIKIIYSFILGLIINITYTKHKNIISPILIHISANTIAIFLTEFNIYYLILSIILILINIKSLTFNKK